MKKRILNAITGIATLFVVGTATAQCPTITCPSDITVSVDAGTCGALVNYSTPVGVDLCTAGSVANILFVSDNAGGIEIPAVLSAAGHTVTVVYNDYNLGNNLTLQGSLSAYDVVFWNAVGLNGSGEAHNASTFTNLYAYVNAGGAVYVTGYDVIASPTDPELITFLGGASSWDVMGGVTAINGPANSLTDGVTNIVGLTLNNSADHDGLDGLVAGVSGIVQNGTGGWEWTLRTYGSGQIAWVSSGQYATNPLPAWSTPGSGYHESLLNFAYNHSCAAGTVLVVSDYPGGAPEIAPLLISEGYNVVEVSGDFLGGNNATLQGSLSAYDLIIWHAVGTGYGDVHNAATFANLTTFINGGGALMVHGYDVIASPSDIELINFLGGTSSVDVPGNGGLGTIVGPANTLTDGVTNIVGLTLNNSGDHDALVGIGAGTVGVAPNSSGWDWTLRTMGAGEIAWVSTGQNTSTFPLWNTPGSGYHEALLNFTYHHGGCSVPQPITTLIAGLPDGSTFPVGTTTVTYEVTDYLGNNPQSCSFLVTVVDDEAPVADIAVLADVNDECSSTPTAPTATDNCNGSITATPDVTFPITTPGTTVVTWTYTDGAGNSSTQTQNVVLADVTSPVADVATLADVNDECSSIPTAPTATDNCNGSITATPDVTFPITTPGTTVVTWTYTDGAGNSSTQTQNVVLADVTSPVADVATLTGITECFELTPTAPTATDNCDGAITATPDVTFPITAPGTTVITWTYTDGAGNSSTQTQNIIINTVDNGVTQTGTTLSADAATATYQWLDCDNSYAIIAGETAQTFVPSSTVGNYAVEVTENGCVDTSACYIVDYSSIGELNFANTSVYPNPNNGAFNVHSTTLLNKIVITDASGKILFETIDINGATTKIYVNNIQNGLYFVKLFANESSVIHPVIVH